MVDPEFLGELERLHRTYTGRPSIITEVPRFAEHAGGARVILKREDLNHTGSHKINNVLGQALLTKRMGKTRVIAETGAGQHGVATATAAALFGLECTVYMGEVDTERQALNVARMRLLGAEVVPVTTGSAHAQGRHQRGVARLGRQRRRPRTTSSAPSPARTRSPRWSATSTGSSASRPAAQVLDLVGRLPDAVVACVGGGSNAMGIFHAFIDDAGGAAGRLRGRRRGRRDRPARGAVRRPATPGVLHGAFSYVLQDDDGQTIESHSISAGLDYPGVGPEHACLHDIGRAEYRSVTDDAGDGGVRAALPHRGHHPGHRVARTPWPARWRSGSELGPGRRCCWSTSPGAATRTWTPPRRCFGLLDEERQTHQ